MGKPKILNKKNSSHQSKISSYFKKQTESDNKCKPNTSNTSRINLSKVTMGKQDVKDIPLIVLDDSRSNTPKSGISIDSSVEFIAGTPESDTKSLILSHVKNSPDMIPPTPIPFEGNKSRVCLNNKFLSFTNNKKLNFFKAKETLSVKRRADGKTGMSPNAKKLDHIDEEQKRNASLIKKNIFNEISTVSINSSNIDDDSPSLLQPFMKPSKIPPRRSKSPWNKTTPGNNCLKKENASNLDPKNDSLPIGITALDLKGENVNGITSKTKVNQYKINTIKIEDENCSQKKIDFADDEDMIKYLTENIDQMSPFKDKPIQNESKWGCIYEKEKITKNSFAASGNYNRYLVTFVDKKAYGNILVLTIKSLLDGMNCFCNLSGFWYDSLVKEGDIVNILLTEQEDGVYNVTNTQGILVVNPDILISGTSIVAGVFCRRKAILNEKFKGVDGGNKSMLIGSLVHELFQSIVSMKSERNICFEDLVQKLVLQKEVLVALYGLNMTEIEITAEIKSFLPTIEKWRNTYMKGLQTSGKDEWKGRVCDVIDIEENVWSPRYGIKGKIDLTVNTKQNGMSKVMPLELKTGKSSYSAEHRGQVTLYSMMSSDRREDPKSGLLLYLKNLSMNEIPAGEKEKRGLIQLRNELVSYLHQRLEDKNMPSLPLLPEPLDNERLCQKCPQLLTCSTMLTIQKEVPLGAHSMSKLAPASVAHLSQAHLDYFRHWCLLLHLETWKETVNNRNKALWGKDAEEREEMGECIGKLSLSVEKAVEDSESSQYMHFFSRDSHLYGDIPKKNFKSGESVIISSNSEIALGIGIVANIDETGVAVILDRNLQKYPSWKRKVYRVDKCEFQSTMGIIYTNLVSLLNEEPHFEKLRELLIDRRVPKFSEGFDKAKVSLMKPILKNLNKNQQRAVLRVLLAEDYLVIKGFPGTGKTSTIVCLVRLLVLFGFSVLLTSYTHSAVDTLLLKLKDHKDCPFLRIGRLSRINPELHQYSEDTLLKNLYTVDGVSNAFNSKPVVATTCLAVNHKMFKRRSFDYCIIDEAAQVLQPAALGPLFQCKKFVLVGDSLQLPPVVKSQTAKSQGMTETLLQRLDGDGSTICLTQQYRMNTEIQRIANQLTYEGHLECASEAVAEATLASHSAVEGPSWLLHVTSSLIEDSVVFIDTKGASPEGKDHLQHPVNSGEGDIINTIVQALQKCGVTEDNIGVVTPYRGQVNLLRNLLHQVEVNTVDQFQGMDRQVILYSCVKSSLAIEVKDTEILNDERRLNVAITRAKCKLVFVGDRATLKLYTPFEKLFSILNPNQLIFLDEK